MQQCLALQDTMLPGRSAAIPVYTRRALMRPLLVRSRPPEMMQCPSTRTCPTSCC